MKRKHLLLDSWQKLTSGSVNRQIFGAAVIVGCLTAFVKVAAMSKELVIAWKFGTFDELEAFLIALIVPSFVISVLANSFNSAFIPTYIRVREQEGIKAAQKLFSGATIWALGLLTIITILILATAPIYLPLIASGFDRQKLDMTFHLLYAIAPIILLSGIVAIWGDVLNAGERFALAAVSPIATPILTILFLVCLPFWGTFALAAGLICGAILEIITLGIGLHKQGISLRPKWYGFDTHMQQIANQYTPMIAGALLICSTGIIDQSMAAMLSPGSVAALNYGTRIIISLLSLMSIALSTAIIPYFSKMLVSQNWIAVGNTFKQYLKLIFITTIPLTILIVIFSEQLVKVFFQRGSFSAENTHVVAQIQFFSAFQIPFFIANILVVRLIASMRENYILMWVSGCNFILNIIGNYLFIKWMGIPGIALSTSCVYIFSFFFVFSFANKQIEKFSNIQNIKTQ